MEEFFNGCIESYLAAGCIGAFIFCLFVLLAFCLAALIDKIWSYVDYCKKRKKVFDKLYPQYLELMKGEENND